jgi:hypothetical protein
MTDNLVLPDDVLWEEEAAEARHNALDNVRSTAKDWSQSIGLIVGAFTTAAFLKGPEAFTDVPGDGFTLRFQAWIFDITYDPRITAIALVFIGAIVLTLALAAASYAAQGTPGWTEQLTGRTYRIKSTKATKSAIKWLAVSRGATAIAAAIILLGTAIAWVAQLEKPKAESSQSAIVQLETSAVCGVLSHASDGSLRVTPSGGAEVAIPGAGNIAVVESCP